MVSDPGARPARGDFAQALLFACKHRVSPKSPPLKGTSLPWPWGAGRGHLPPPENTTRSVYTPTMVEGGLPPASVE